MIASTLLAMKFWIWLICLETSSLASSTCNVTPGTVLPYSVIPFRRMVRKLSSNLSIEMPIFAARGALDVTVTAARNPPLRRTLENLRIGLSLDLPFLRGCYGLQVD